MSPKQSNRFIVLEGIDASGKSTQCRMLSDKLNRKNIPFVSLREPGDTKIAELIRGWLSQKSDVHPTTELFLLEAARSSLIHQKIIPALEADKLVILDRFIYSTLAYQGYARGIDKSFINEVNKFATLGLSPQKVFLMDIEPNKSVERLLTKKKDRWESEDALFHEKVRNGYLDLAQNNPSIWEVVDASLPVKQIHDQIWSYVESVI